LNSKPTSNTPHSLKFSFLAVLAITQFSVLAVSVFFSFKLFDLLEARDVERTLKTANYITGEIKQDTTLPVLAALSVSTNEPLIAAFANGRFEQLQLQADSIWKSLEPQGLSQFSFFLPTDKGIIAYYKAHQPKVHGELISKARVMVEQCVKGQKLISGLEQGKSGYGFRAVNPLFYKQKFIGCLEFGSKFSESFLEKLNEYQEGQWQMVNLNRGIKTAEGQSDIISTFGKDARALVDSVGQMSASAKILQEINDGKVSFFRNELTEMASIFTPVKIFNGNVSLYIKVKFKTDYFAKVRATKLASLAIALFGLIVSASMIWLLYRQITIPISKLVSETLKIKDFHLEPRPPVRTNLTEVRSLVDAVDIMKTGLVSFKKYVPAQLVQRLIASGQEAFVGGKRKELTVFFSDIEGFTTISETIDPTDLTEQLSEYLTAVTDIIYEEQGTVDKYIGDAVMAFWGALPETSEHARLACRAALRVQIKIDELGSTWTKSGKPVFNTRIGINTGDVVVGNIGSAQRLSYTIIGDQVNLASRIEGINKTYSTRILVSEKTMILCGDEFELKKIDFVIAKGKTNGVFLYELIGLKSLAPEKRLRYNEKFGQAVDLITSQKWDEANLVLESLLAECPDDKVLPVLVKRCDEKRDPHRRSSNKAA
jgi:class 3 adenylate cyclase